MIIIKRGTNVLKKKRHFFAAVGFVVMWSSGFIGARLSTAEADAITVLMWRFIVASMILGCWWLWKSRQKLSAKSIVHQALIGLMSQAGYLYCVFSSVQHGVSAGTSNLITVLQPIVTAVLAGLILKETTNMKQWGGLLFGIVGVLFVVYDDLGFSSQTPLWAYALSFLAMIFLVCATFYEKILNHSVSLTNALFIQTFVSAFCFMVLAFVTDNAMPPRTTNFWLSIVWVAGLST